MAMETFNEKIKRLRKSKGLNQTEVCSLIGITQPSFASIESGRTKSINIELGKSIANALDVSFNELFNIELPINKDIAIANEEITELKDKIKTQGKMISLQTEMIELFKKYDAHNTNELKKMKRIQVLIKEVSSKFPNDAKYEEVMEAIKEATIEMLKIEFPNSDNTLQ